MDRSDQCEQLAKAAKVEMLTKNKSDEKPETNNAARIPRPIKSENIIFSKVGYKRSF